MHHARLGASLAGHGQRAVEPGRGQPPPRRGRGAVDIKVALSWWLEQLQQPRLAKRLVDGIEVATAPP